MQSVSLLLLVFYTAKYSYVETQIMRGKLQKMDIQGLNDLWKETLGDPSVCVAILDGPVDQSHTTFVGTDFRQFELLVPISSNHGPALAHGTHIASVIFGQHSSEVKGVAPRCRGISIPIFNDGINGSIAPCSQLDLARAINQAVQEGAHIINISGGELSLTGIAHPILVDAVENCLENNVLIIAAAGNDGCDCLHIPGALPAVLAVGAMDTDELPMNFSNWGERYQTQGILAPGMNIVGASAEGGIAVNSGTSYATPIVSGVAALLLSLQRKNGQKLNPHMIREVILSNALGCDEQAELMSDCRRLLAGRLSIQDAITQIKKGETHMLDSTEITETKEAIVPSEIRNDSIGQDGDRKISKTTLTSSALNSSNTQLQRASFETSDASGISASMCETCATVNTDNVSPPSPQLVFALGRLGFDYGTEARRDSIMQHMDQPANPDDPCQCIAFLEKNPWEAASIIWTLSLDATPIYAIQPHGAFAGEICRRLCEFLGDHVRGEIERVSIPGYLNGRIQLSNGQVVPVIFPDLRGMYSWNTATLVEAICGKPPADKTQQSEKDIYIKKVQAVENFLQRVYVDLRNLGTTPQERSINYAATNAFQVAEVFQNTLQAEMDLDTIEVERSPISRPESNCWDVKLTFFNPNKVYEQARKVYLFTIDVSDVVPVMVGAVRSWFIR